MATSVVTVDRATPYKEIARLLAEDRISGMPVLKLGREVAGVVTEADLLAAESKTAPVAFRRPPGLAVPRQAASGINGRRADDRADHHGRPARDRSCGRPRDEHPPRQAAASRRRAQQAELPPGADADDVTAGYANGILTIKVAVRGEPKEVVKRIPVTAGKK